MIKIENTEINGGAFITLIATLKELNKDTVVEILDEGKRVVIRPKEEHEKVAFNLNLKKLEEYFERFMVKGDQHPLILEGEDEAYLRNLSFACDFYLQEEHRQGEFDFFGLFHRIHFVKISDETKIDNELLRLICGLFRVDFSKCNPYVVFEKNINEKLLLSTKDKLFNEIFDTITIKSNNDEIKITFESGKLEAHTALNALYSIKDLLYAKGIDVSRIPERISFFVPPTNHKALFEFHISEKTRLILHFGADYFKLEMTKAHTILKAVETKEQSSTLPVPKEIIKIPFNTPKNSLCPCGSGKLYKRCHGLIK